ncbi:hypothetical protein [Intrasporangium sp.]|jgi:hypothetical protein|uniref:DUF6912 family protein n=1 Tax=Intrasporangium sp. TaxID=1925024 RepID=UPI00336587A4
MPVIRVYVPIGRRDLDDLAQTGALDVDRTRPRNAFAVTDELRSVAAGLDLEDLEFTAFSDAVAASGAARSMPGDRRIVVSADADPAWVLEGDGQPVSRVRLVASVPMRRIASFHVDETAGAAIDVGADDLLWYDATELDEVRALLA